MASELQERLSNWSRMGMQKDFNDIFDKVCPPEQTWRIQSLELDLGAIDYKELETELSPRLRSQLLEKLIDLVIYASKSGQNNIEILDEATTQISMLQSFLLSGLLPWSHKSVDGSVNQMMTYQLEHNKKNVISMLWEVGATHADVRKRIAWQFNEPVIIKIIEGLEPNNHSQIVEFSNDLTKIQQEESVVQTSIADFKKNVWLWVLNYLLTERGTIYNKVAFVKSSIRQMANHYNIAYAELLDLIQRAVDRIQESSHVKPDFILTLKVLTKENKPSEKNPRRKSENTIDYWSILRIFFQNPSQRKTNPKKSEFNDLVVSLCKEDKTKFTELITSLGSSGELWSSAIADLNDTSLETIFSALSPSGSTRMLGSIYFLIELGTEMK
ncbi:MAG TPA: contractile injection system tape measure protein, partial [Bacteroidia bacterium]|nr:contractile injection system tape measure protein [Bacteroidia bacterium]